MALSTLDPTVALVAVDLQAGVVAMPTVHPAADVVRRASALAEAFRRHDLPVVLVTVAGRPPGRTEQSHSLAAYPRGFTAPVPELDRRPTDHLVVKYARGAFSDTGLVEYLREQQVTQVVLAGIATSGGVESSARQAYDYGFNVTLAIDAMTDTRPGAHEYSIGQVFPRIAETGTTEQVIALLERTRP